MNAADLNQYARALRNKPLTPMIRAQLEELRASADKLGVGAIFDKTVQQLFPDVYGRGGLPLPKITSGGPAQSVSSTSAGMGGALAFYALKDVAALAKAVEAKVPALHTSTPSPIPFDQQFPVLSAAHKRDLRAELQKELGDVRVRDANGHRVSLLEKLTAVPAIDIERVLDTLVEVKAGYVKMGLLAQSGGMPYQDVNWKHTRLEIDRVIDVARNSRLTPPQTEVALLASIVSDSVKAPSNFIVHNVHGAEAALKLLSRRTPPPSADMIEDVVKATLEHQIGPPNFMGNIALRGYLGGQNVDRAVVDSICAKVAQPLNEKNLTADRTQIAFTDVERRALQKVGVFAWTVPHDNSRHYLASRAVIDSDSLVNYACPDGWAKLAALHGPDQPPFLQEPLVRDGLLSERPEHASALKSFQDARSVVSPETLKRYDAGLQSTTYAVTHVERELLRWAALQRDVPKTKDGKIPYLDAALDYRDAQQVNFARRLREQAVTLLRQQEGIW